MGYSSDGGDVSENADSQTEEEWDLPKHLDQEWFAFEIWTEPLDDDQSVDDPEDQEIEPTTTGGNTNTSYTPQRSSHTLAVGFARHDIQSSKNSRSPDTHSHKGVVNTLSSTSATVRSNLSLLECLLRLTSLQNYQQASHLTVHDELLNLFLSDANSWLGSRESREREREDARRRIGFDPFGSRPSSAGGDMDASNGHVPGGQEPQKTTETKLQRSLYSITPDTHSSKGQGPDAQPLLEGSGNMSGRTIIHSYPPTPTPSSISRSRYERIRITSELSSKERL